MLIKYCETVVMLTR